MFGNFTYGGIALRSFMGLPSPSASPLPFRQRPLSEILSNGLPAPCILEVPPKHSALNFDHSHVSIDTSERGIRIFVPEGEGNRVVYDVETATVTICSGDQQLPLKENLLQALYDGDGKTLLWDVHGHIA